MKQNKQALTIRILKKIDQNINLKIFRLFLIAIALITLLAWIVLSKKPDYSFALYLLGIAILSSFFISLFLKYEINRPAYAVCIAVMVVFSISALFSYMHNYRDQNQLRQDIISATEANIASYQNDPLVSSSEKAFVVQEAKNTETSELNKLTKKNSFLPILGCFLLTLGTAYYAIKFEQIIRANEPQSSDALVNVQLETASY